MEDTLITFETAKLVKEKGFNWKVEYYVYDEFNKQTTLKDKPTDYSNYKKGSLYECIGQPTQSLLQKWLREVHEIDINIIFNPDTREYSFECVKWVDGVCNIFKSSGFETYEKALETALQEALKLI